jgi:hypothetical protein
VPVSARPTVDSELVVGLDVQANLVDVVGTHGDRLERPTRWLKIQKERTWSMRGPTRDVITALKTHLRRPQSPSAQNRKIGSDCSFHASELLENCSFSDRVGTRMTLSLRALVGFRMDLRLSILYVECMQSHLTDIRSINGC